MIYRYFLCNVSLLLIFIAHNSFNSLQKALVSNHEDSTFIIEGFLVHEDESAIEGATISIIDSDSLRRESNSVDEGYFVMELDWKREYVQYGIDLAFFKEGYLHQLCNYRVKQGLNELGSIIIKRDSLFTLIDQSLLVFKSRDFNSVTDIFQVGEIVIDSIGKQGELTSSNNELLNNGNSITYNGHWVDILFRVNKNQLPSRNIRKEEKGSVFIPDSIQSTTTFACFEMEVRFTQDCQVYNKGREVYVQKMKSRNYNTRLLSYERTSAMPWLTVLDPTSADTVLVKGFSCLKLERNGKIPLQKSKGACFTSS